MGEHTQIVVKAGAVRVTFNRGLLLLTYVDKYDRICGGAQIGVVKPTRIYENGWRLTNLMRIIRQNNPKRKSKIS